MNAEMIELTMNELIDYLCEMNGVGWTIKYLYENCAWTTDELNNAGFDMVDIDDALAEIGELKDGEEEFEDEDEDN